MRKLLLVIIALITVLSGVTLAQKPTAILGPGLGVANFRAPFHQKVNRTLYKDTTYILTGWYFVDSTYSLTIQPGTLVRGDSASAGTLIISRGAKILAEGTKANPIVFTSNKLAGQRSPGDWGGVIVLGNAPTNKPATQQIEGGFGTIPNTYAMYGGSDSLDNSGTLKYIRIEFAGIAFAQDNEINGLTFGGVGRGTTVEYIQVSYANDDDIECFGGNVDLKHIVSMGQVDDSFDTDYGYYGRAQFYYIVRDPSLFDASASGSSNGFESDNEGSAPYSATPRTKARLSNFTLVGPLSDTSATVNSHWGNLAMLRRATELSVYNSIIVGWPNGLNIRDTLTQNAAMAGRLEIKNTSIACRNTPVITSSSPTTPNAVGWDVVAWFNGTGSYPTTNNKGGSIKRTGMDVGLPTAAWSLSPGNNPVPTANSEAATAGTAFDGRLAGDTWFDNTVTYRGAFDPSKSRSQQWDAGWTNYDPKNYNPETGVEEGSTLVPSGFDLSQNYPNPFNPSTVISFRIPQSVKVSLKVYDILGNEVNTLVNDVIAPGYYNVKWNGNNFNGSKVASGTYVYRLVAGDFVKTMKMMLVK